MRFLSPYFSLQFSFEEQPPPRRPDCRIGASRPPGRRRGPDVLKWEVCEGLVKWSARFGGRFKATVSECVFRQGAEAGRFGVVVPELFVGKLTLPPLPAAF